LLFCGILGCFLRSICLAIFAGVVLGQKLPADKPPFPPPKVKNEVEKLPRQQRKGNMKVKMDDFAQKKQTMVRLEEVCHNSRIGKCVVDRSILPP